MARPKKPAELRQNRETKNLTLASVSDAGLAIPEAPVTLNVKAKKQWAAFWRSPSATVVNADSDGFAVERWIVYVNEWYDCTKELNKKDAYLVDGSQGQKVINPLARHRAVIETALSALEKQLGLTPAARAQLGIAVNTLKKSSSDLLNDLREMEPVILEG
jgi:P27 family predicted phage terminase small subunit